MTPRPRPTSPGGLPIITVLVAMLGLVFILNGLSGGDSTAVSASRAQASLFGLSGGQPSASTSDPAGERTDPAPAVPSPTPVATTAPIVLPTLVPAVPEPTPAIAAALDQSVQATTPVPATPVPATPVPATPVPATPVPATPVPATPVPATPVPATPVPATPAPATPIPATPVPATPIPATPMPATPIPATPVPATPVPATPVPATPVPTATPWIVEAAPTPTAIPAPALGPQRSIADMEAYVLTEINAVRAQVGLGPVALRNDISIIARDWSATMAQVGGISHRPQAQLSAMLPAGWSGWAENVAEAPSIEWAQSALNGSPGHYANMTGNYNVVGIGVAVASNGQVFVTHNFARY